MNPAVVELWWPGEALVCSLRHLAGTPRYTLTGKKLPGDSRRFSGLGIKQQKKKNNAAVLITVVENQTDPETKWLVGIVVWRPTMPAVHLASVLWPVSCC